MQYNPELVTQNIVHIVPSTLCFCAFAALSSAPVFVPKEKKEPEPKQPVQVPQQQVPVQAPVQADQYNDEYDPELDAEEIPEAPPFQEILPMKRYYLIGRLRELKSRLDQNNIQNEDFDIIVKFTNNLSYGSLVSLASGIIPVVEEQLARLTTNAQ